MSIDQRWLERPWCKSLMCAGRRRTAQPCGVRFSMLMYSSKPTLITVRPILTNKISLAGQVGPMLPVMTGITKSIYPIMVINSIWMIWAIWSAMTLMSFSRVHGTTNFSTPLALRFFRAPKYWNMAIRKIMRVIGLIFGLSGTRLGRFARRGNSLWKLAWQ